MNEDQSIPCPPRARGGCGCTTLALKRILKSDWIAKLVKDVDQSLKLDVRLPFSTDLRDSCNECSRGLSKESSNDCLREAAHRKGAKDNFIYCPTVEIIKKEGLKHFQRHWIKGEPVIVRNVVDKVASVSWEPMVMWRALRESDKNKFDDEETNSLKAVDCLDWCQVHSLWMMYLYTGSHLNLNKRETSCTSPILKMRILLHYYLAGGYKYSSIF
mgnify:FL=1